jgi:hypothetical protein
MLCLTLYLTPHKPDSSILESVYYSGTAIYINIWV